MRKVMKLPAPDRRHENGRDHDPKTGRFVKGNSGGPGRATRQKERDLLKLLVATCTPEEMSVVYQRALVDAQQGDAQARVWLGKYLLPNVSAISQNVVQQTVLTPAGTPFPTLAEAVKMLNDKNPKTPVSSEESHINLSPAQLSLLVSGLKQT